MAEIRIRYADKVGGREHHHITRLASEDHVYTRKQVIDRLESLGKVDTFHVLDKDGHKVPIYVVDDRVHGKYVRTAKDGQWQDNLVNLPAVPSNIRSISP
jgi:hypothetical protein